MGCRTGANISLKGFFLLLLGCEISSKHSFFTFRAIKPPLMMCLRPFCTPEIIYLYENLTFGFLVIVRLL